MTDEPRKLRPFDQLGVLAVQRVALGDGLQHVEVYTMSGLLTLFWHGDPAAKQVAILCGGAMGGLLGPAGLYHHLGGSFADKGIGTIRVSYRQANDLNACVLDLGAAADLANRNGAERFVMVGHSFGGAVAVNAGVALKDRVGGVVTLATQSAGCERAAMLGDVPLLLFHGDRDEILPVAASEAVRTLSGGNAELVVLAGAGHLLKEAEADIRARLLEWIPARLAT